MSSGVCELCLGEAVLSENVLRSQLLTRSKELMVSPRHPLLELKLSKHRGHLMDIFRCKKRRCDGNVLRNNMSRLLAPRLPPCVILSQGAASCDSLRPSVLLYRMFKHSQSYLLLGVSKNVTIAAMALALAIFATSTFTLGILAPLSITSTSMGKDVWAVPIAPVSPLSLSRRDGSQLGLQRTVALELATVESQVCGECFALDDQEDNPDLHVVW